MGVRYMQGYLFARPGFQMLPVPVLPDEMPLRLMA